MHSGEPTRLQCHKALEGVKKNGRRIASQLPAPVCMSVMKVSTKMIWRNKWKSLCNERLLHQRGKKKHPTGLYQILSDVMCMHQCFDTSDDCRLDRFRVFKGCASAPPVNTHPPYHLLLFAHTREDLLSLLSKSMKYDCAR